MREPNGSLLVVASLLAFGLGFGCQAEAQVPQWQDTLNADSRMWSVQIEIVPDGDLGEEGLGLWFPMGTAVHGDRRILCVVGFVDGCERLLFDDFSSADNFKYRVAEFPPPIRGVTITRARLYLHARGKTGAN